MVEHQQQGDAELIDRARRAANGDAYFGQPVLLRKLADRLAALTTPVAWRSVSELPAILERVFVRVGEDRTEVGYRTRGFACGWADDEGRCLPGVTGWQPIVRPMP